MIENIPFSGIFNLAVLSCYRRKTGNLELRSHLMPRCYFLQQGKARKNCPFKYYQVLSSIKYYTTSYNKEKQEESIINNQEKLEDKDNFRFYQVLISQSAESFSS